MITMLDNLPYRTQVMTSKNEWKIAIVVVFWIVGIEVIYMEYYIVLYL